MKRKTFFLFLSEILAALALQLAPPVSRGLSSDAWSILYFICLYVLHPLFSLLFPWYLTCKKGLPALLVFFPFGLFLLLFPFYPDGRTMGFVCLALGLISSSVAQALQTTAPRRRTRRRRPPC